MASAEKIINYKHDNYLLISKNNKKIEDISSHLLNTLASGALQSGNQPKKESNLEIK